MERIQKFRKGNDLSLDGSIPGMTAFREIGVEVFDDADTDTIFFLDVKSVLMEK